MIFFIGSLQKPNRKRIPVEAAFAGFERGKDDKDKVGDKDDGNEDEADEDEEGGGGGDEVNGHRDLEVEGFLAVLVDVRVALSFPKPEEEWREDVGKGDAGEASEGEYMTKDREGAILGLSRLFTHGFNIGQRREGGYYNLGEEFHRVSRLVVGFALKSHNAQPAGYGQRETKWETPEPLALRGFWATVTVPPTS